MYKEVVTSLCTIVITVTRNHHIFFQDKMSLVIYQSHCVGSYLEIDISVVPRSC